MWQPQNCPNKVHRWQLTVLFQIIHLSHVTCQVVSDEIGCCPVSHKEWSALKTHCPKTLFFFEPCGCLGVVLASLTKFRVNHRSLTNWLVSKICPLGHRSHSVKRLSQVKSRQKSSEFIFLTTTWQNVMFFDFYMMGPVNWLSNMLWKLYTQIVM